MTRDVLGVALICIAAGLIGCGLTGPDPCRPPDPDCTQPPPPEYIRFTPRQAVEYLRHSWADRDSTRADSIYAVDYEGNSVDLADPASGTFTFFKSDEVRAINGLKNDANVVRLDMDFPADTLGWEMFSDAADPPEWVGVQVRGPLIYVYYVDSRNDLIVSGSKTLEFKTRPVQVGSQTLWEVVRSTEVHDDPEGGTP